MPRLASCEVSHFASRKCALSEVTGMKILLPHYTLRVPQFAAHERAMVFSWRGRPTCPRFTHCDCPKDHNRHFVEDVVLRKANRITR
jgi:hypothetical protein